MVVVVVWMKALGLIKTANLGDLFVFFSWIQVYSFLASFSYFFEFVPLITHLQIELKC